MTTVAKRELKSKMSAYLRMVEKSGEELIITDHGHFVLKIVPMRGDASVDHAFGDIRKKVKPASREALLAPLTSEWEGA